ncbi:redox-regulated ATPase YchF [Candidatus Uhrbacteria bacterium CG_4_10_14_0_8_um_filter_58_22]|uniref:Ribosome-binding ATPase YchF n=1 Tax=Candidatus Uhrbacteria bacterium CG_4_10_14_0_8_um_filter_58_22 TaxID=1975029 RepID=A0A2M7QC96_9BACT|nr:MAG: redox-regulated ATPase YchF [Parcubacteria group bacterium CG1_02_58_44]PIY63406.1 MAG: redox-regulated ATPase YchF [Candidatus Uhrbacteria bacterium CG_4_10_14_0_8_um_filter_58_22]
MSLKVGIVGLPNVGKSTLFKAVTKKQVDCANFPFCTIEPNVGVVAVPDDRLNRLSEVSKSKQTIPTTVDFVDIAGLVKGASEGEGLGNQFLSHIREVDAIIEVIRAFENDDIVHVSGKIDPADDVETINLELIYADLSVVGKRLDGLRKSMKAGETHEQKLALSAFEKVNALLSVGRPAREADLTEDEAKPIKDVHLLTAKPLLYVVNVDETQLKSDFRIPSLPSELQIPLCVKMEEEIAALPAEEVQEYLDALGLSMTGLDQLIRASYDLLGLITYFTSGEKESRAWTVRRGTKAPQAAGVIHTDFEKGFIRAEVINWRDFVELGEVGSKEAGKLRVEGKEYVMQDGDTCHFRVST